jgi:homoserine O-acetyltransferase/O-succinyltransferase
MGSPDSQDPAAAARAAFVSAETRWWDLPDPLRLELGGALRGVRVAYRSWGRLAADGENAVVVCHALTGSADVDRWWPQMFGSGQALDPDRDFIVCSNILGSCYGTTGPTSIDPETGRAYLGAFPSYTVRDMVRLQAALMRGLGVRRIRAVIGGSLGGMQTLEWALMYPELVESIVPIANPARHSAWAIGLSEAQRQAIFADPRWRDGQYDPSKPPAAGLAAARMMAMCTYRGFESYQERFARRLQAADLFAMESYLRYQGQQLVERFDAATYVGLTEAMDSHDVARGRGEFGEVLRGLKLPALVVSIDSDVLYPPCEQAEIAGALPNARMAILHSPHGHDAFLIEVEELSSLVAEFRGRSSIARPQPIRERAPREGVALLVLGTGRVGAALLEQVRSQRSSLESDYGIGLRVAGIANSRAAIFDEQGMDLGHWRELLEQEPPGGQSSVAALLPLLERLSRFAFPVLLDLTAVDWMDDLYCQAFRMGIHVVGANKRPLAADRPRRERLLAARREGRCHHQYEATVGSSLPVIDTLQNLVRTGDRIGLIEGSLSGSLGFISTEVMKGTPLSLAVRWAKELGHTEPDPREDLSGLDVARKMVILARELGFETSVEDVRIDPFVPGEVFQPGSLDALYQALRRGDDAFAARVAESQRQGKVLRYLSRIAVTPRGVELQAGMQAVDSEDRAARLRDVEAFVAFTTERYRQHPLVVQGAGVGEAATAGCVLAEVLRIATSLGARASWSG